MTISAIALSDTLEGTAIAMMTSGGMDDGSRVQPPLDNVVAALRSLQAQQAG
jgi:hypothetical protein